MYYTSSIAVNIMVGYNHTIKLFFRTLLISQVIISIIIIIISTIKTIFYFYNIIIYLINADMGTVNVIVSQHTLTTLQSSSTKQLKH